jgi:hypothetical protein
MKLKYIKHLAFCVVLTLALTVSAFASPVPDNLVVENLNGQQRMVKTYVLPPNADPEMLKEPSFEYDGFFYAWAYTTKEEHTFLETKAVTETVTVETAKKDLNTVLEQLAPTLPYDDGEYAGELSLDHTTLSTVAAGYANRSGKVTATKTIGPLDRNDMSYVPATTVKDGRTLSLVNVEWQVIGTDMVGDVLAPCSYQAVATYSASTSYQVATGYVTTVEYKGQVVSQGVDSVTYTVVYVGTEIVPEEPEPTEPAEPSGVPLGGIAAAVGGTVLLVLLLAGAAGAGVYLFRHRKNVYIYVPGDKPRDYKLVAKFRAEPETPEVDIRNMVPYPDTVIAVEIKRPLAKKLVGQTFTVHHRTADYTYTVLRDRPADWHEFNPTEEKEDII